MTSQRFFSVVIVMTLSGILASANIAHANLTVSENLASFGTFSQINSGVTYTNYLNVGPNACVPTSVANSLIYLNNTYSVPDLLQTGYNTVNTLAQDMGTFQGSGTNDPNGTSWENWQSGLSTYLINQGVSSRVSITSAVTTPNPLQLYNWLTLGKAVGIAINWDAGGGHALSLYSIDISTNNLGNPIGGTLGFVDPWGEPAGASATAVTISAATFIVTNNSLYVSGGYLGGAGGSTNDPDNPGTSGTGSIGYGLAISVVPEPASCLLLGVGVLAVLISLRRRI